MHLNTGRRARKHEWMKLKEKEQQLTDTVTSKKQHIAELRSKQQLLQKEIMKIKMSVKQTIIILKVNLKKLKEQQFLKDLLNLLKLF